MATKRKVLIIQETISDYNVPAFEELAKNYDITLLFSDERCKERKYSFKTKYIPWRRKLRRRLHTENLIKIANQFDVVICMFSFSYLYFYLFGIIPNRKFRLIYWGIGVSASYNDRYDINQKPVRVFLKWIRRSDATVFYCDYPIEKYKKLGVDSKKLFVANNTTSVKRIVPNPQRCAYLFVGSLYRQKKIDVLIDEYAKAYSKNRAIPELKIVGDGAERGILLKQIENLGVGNKVHLLGEIKDEERLSELFNESLLCFSPDQAGLSVLKAMGYGCVFVTHKDAITGGEKFNIQNGDNGILLNSFEEISELMLDSANNREKYLSIGNRAFTYYWNNRKPEDMAKGFADAIEYCMTI